MISLTLIFNLEILVCIIFKKSHIINYKNVKLEFTKWYYYLGFILDYNTKWMLQIRMSYYIDIVYKYYSKEINLTKTL